MNKLNQYQRNYLLNRINKIVEGKIADLEAKLTSRNLKSSMYCYTLDEVVSNIKSGVFKPVNNPYARGYDARYLDLSQVFVISPRIDLEQAEKHDSGIRTKISKFRKQADKARDKVMLDTDYASVEKIIAELEDV